MVREGFLPCPRETATGDWHLHAFVIPAQLEALCGSF
jgi:hypothetical protein